MPLLCCLLPLLLLLFFSFSFSFFLGFSLTGTPPPLLAQAATSSGPAQTTVHGLQAFRAKVFFKGEGSSKPDFQSGPLSLDGNSYGVSQGGGSGFPPVGGGIIGHGGFALL